jgi:16S rRNA processing protein RimM
VGVEDQAESADPGNAAPAAADPAVAAPAVAAPTGPEVPAGEDAAVASPTEPDASTAAGPSTSAAPPAAPGDDPLRDWIAVGEVMGAFGPRGELRVKPLGRFPERFRELRRVYVGESHAPAAVLHRRSHGEGLLIRLDTVKSRDAARALFGQFLYVPESEAVQLPEGEFFVHQVVGLRVLTTGGDELGTVRDVLQTGSNDVYVVRAKGGREVLLPAIKDVVKRIDPAGGLMEVELLPGLLDDE